MSQLWFYHTCIFTSIKRPPLFKDNFFWPKRGRLIHEKSTNHAGFGAGFPVETGSHAMCACVCIIIINEGPP